MELQQRIGAWLTDGGCFFRVGLLMPDDIPDIVDETTDRATA